MRGYGRDVADPSTPRPRHLMDPADPRPPASRRDPMSVERVQRWVLSALATTTILHLSVGLVIGAVLIGDEHVAARVGLNVVAAGFGIVAVVVARAIHRRPPASPWLLLGVVPGVVGLAVCFG